MTSKMVSDRFQSMRAIEGSLEQNADAVATRIAARLRPHLRAGEEMPDVALLARLMGRELEALATALVRADREHASELADDVGPRAARDRAAAMAREVYTDLRNTVLAAYPEEALALLRLREPASTVASVLAEQAHATREALIDPALSLPAPRRRGTTLARDAFAAELSEAALALSRALDDVHREAKEADAKLAAKGEAMDTYDAAFGRVVPALSALYGLAEQDVLAGKLRVSRRSRGVLEDASPPVPAPATDEG